MNRPEDQKQDGGRQQEVQAEAVSQIDGILWTDIRQMSIDKHTGQARYFSEMRHG